MQHEKKLVKKFNKLCQIYINNFKEYWSNKNVQINFKDIVHPVTSISSEFNMSDWKYQIEDNPLIVVNVSYEQRLLGVIKKYYMNEDHSLQLLL